MRVWCFMTLRFGAVTRLRASGFRAIALAGLVAVAGVSASETAVAAPDAAIVVDAKTGKTLYAESADAKRYPASLTKMMTLYLLFDALESGKTKLTSNIVFSAHASAQAPSKLGLKPGQTIKVRDAILALVTKSANDVAVAIGEHLGGTETAFARDMTRKARALGMKSTTFRNASGLPNSGQVTTARDLAILGRALQEHHPKYYSYFSTPSFVWKGKRIGNHNRLLGRINGVDGIKTGYTRASGFNLVTSVKRGGRQVVAVVLGGESGSSRDKKMAGLIEDYMPKASTGQRIAAPIPGDGPAVASIDPKELPAPRLRPTVDETETASVEPAEIAAPPRMAGSVASLIGANSVFALEAVDQGDTSADEDTSDVETAPAVITGWKIQLAATPTQSSAEDILDRALSKASRVLGSASPYTETVVRGDTKLYRARFAGFAGKTEARAACDYLTKRSFQCLALTD